MTLQQVKRSSHLRKKKDLSHEVGCGSAFDDSHLTMHSYLPTRQICGILGTKSSYIWRVSRLGKATILQLVGLQGTSNWEDSGWMLDLNSPLLSQ